jgi:uncharacterized lipoprotein YddW (UPF0748 family)
MKEKIAVLLVLIIFNSEFYSQTIPPKREFRGAWVASVVNLDWPSSPFLTTSAQKEQLVSIFEDLKNMGINAVIFQIRPECDALYNSSYEPWSYWLTGSQGSPPNPYYDPLEFAVEEAHKRGMELHAWFNPYRAVRSVGSFSISSQHVTYQHPDWILAFGNLRILNPGLPQVRDYNTAVIMDVVRRYDIDGVHFDDYFYPYPPDQITNEDAVTFAEYSRGFTNIADWRRDNVNQQIKQINDSIMAVKPYVKFGISPFGIWRNGVPPGIIGMDAYSQIYADPITWLHDRSVDYLTPQLYWRIGGSQDYSKLMPWWADSTYANERHLYTGHILNTSFSTSELPNQLKLNRNNSKVSGSIWFRADLLRSNTLTFRDSLRQNYYKYKALPPVMEWKDVLPPNPPLNVRYERLEGSGISAITWDLPQTASDGDSAFRYVVYRFNQINILQEDIDDPKNLIEIENKRNHVPFSESTASGPYFYVITSLDRNNNESLISNVLEITLPSVPLLSYPISGANDVTDTVVVKWNYAEGSSSYRFQLSPDSTFSTSMEQDVSGITDTFRIVTNLQGQKLYYWRIQSSNISGVSEFSDAYNFFTAFPSAPNLISPAHATLDVPLNPTLSWEKSYAAEGYQMQLSISLTFSSATTLLDTAGIVDTSIMLSNLTANRNHFWRIRAANQFGSSPWSNTFGFRTTSVVSVEKENIIPESFALDQNYPNPFNPITTIGFQLPNQAYITLKIYDVLGREVATIADGVYPAGHYTINFDASGLSTGIYYYRMIAGDFNMVRKMIITK